MTVTTAPTRQDAATLWSLIRTNRKECEIEKSLICDPLKKAYEDVRQPYLDNIKECEKWERRIHDSMSAWDRVQEQMARVEQARLQAITDLANAKIEAKAEAKGIEPIYKIAPIVQVPPVSIVTQAGTTQGRSTRKVYSIKGESAGGESLDACSPSVAPLLASYPALFVLDMVKFNALAKTGMLDSHPCVVMTEEYVYTQRR